MSTYVEHDYCTFLFKQPCSVRDFISADIASDFDERIYTDGNSCTNKRAIAVNN